MKLRITSILTGILFISLSCSNEEDDITIFQDDPSITTLNGTWIVFSFEDFNAGITEYKTYENSWDRDIIVTFDDGKKPKKLSGANITNTVFGEFDYIAPRQFRLSSLVTTKANQPGWADKFTEAVLDDNAAFAVNSRQLRIYYAGKTKSVTLNKE